MYKTSKNIPLPSRYAKASLDRLFKGGEEEHPPTPFEGGGLGGGQNSNSPVWRVIIKELNIIRLSIICNK
jgi:hypothetical protein